MSDSEIQNLLKLISVLGHVASFSMTSLVNINADLEQTNRDELSLGLAGAEANFP